MAPNRRETGACGTTRGNVHPVHCVQGVYGTSQPGRFGRHLKHLRGPIQVEGLVDCKVRGGSSPLGRMRKAPQRGAVWWSRSDRRYARPCAIRSPAGRNLGPVTGDWHRQALEDAALPDMPLHALRHTAAAAWLAAGNPLIDVQRQLGQHADISATECYYGHLERHVSAAGSQLRKRLRVLERPRAKAGTAGRLAEESEAPAITTRNPTPHEARCSSIASLALRPECTRGGSVGGRSQLLARAAWFRLAGSMGNLRAMEGSRRVWPLPADRVDAARRREAAEWHAAIARRRWQEVEARAEELANHLNSRRGIPNGPRMPSLAPRGG